MDLNDPAFSVKTVSLIGTTLNRPTALAFGTASDQLWVTDAGNQQVKLLTLTSSSAGTLTTYLGGYRTIGTLDSSFGPSARFNGPSGMMWVNGIGLLISDTLNNSIRLATNYTPFGSTNYAVSTFAGTAGSAGFVNGATTARSLIRPTVWHSISRTMVSWLPI